MDQETAIENKQVLILGGGIAGLSAAKALTEQGIPWELIEGRTRLGGRVFTLIDDGEPVELGAEFIHGENSPTLDLLRRNGVDIYKSSDFASSDSEFSTPSLGNISVPGEDKSVFELIHSLFPVDSLARRNTLRFIEGFHAADPKLMSAKRLLQLVKEETDSKNFRCTHGYSQLVECLLKDLNQGNIQQGQEVTAVEWNSSGVKVRTSQNREFKGRRAIVTFPLSILKSAIGGHGTVAFFPPLQAKSEALERLHVGRVEKVIFKLAISFWNKVPPSAPCFTFEQKPFSFWWTRLPKRSPYLVGAAGGPTALAMSTLSKDQILDLALVSLAEGLGFPKVELEKEVEARFYHSWSQDRFALGAYSYVGVGGAEARGQLALPLDGALFFAGEATHSVGEDGTVSSAFASGLRAAGEIRDQSNL